MIMQRVIEAGIWKHRAECQPNKGTSLTQQEHWGAIDSAQGWNQGRRMSLPAWQQTEREEWSKRLSVCGWDKKKRQDMELRLKYETLNISWRKQKRFDKTYGRERVKRKQWKMKCRDGGWGYTGTGGKGEECTAAKWVWVSVRARACSCVCVFVPNPPGSV